MKLGGILLLVALGVGCRAPYALEERWLPLVEVAERPDLLVSGSVATTLGTRIYVADLKAWLDRFPPGSVEQEALLLHEQVHAERQLATGLGAWLARYLNDPQFAWREEQLGWFLQLKTLQAAGRPLFPTVIAAVLAEYRVLSGAIVSHAEALAWVQDVLAGRWTPDALGVSGG